MKGFIRNIYYLYKYALGKTKLYYRGNSKSKLTILFELLYWWFKEGYFNSMYYAFGMNQEGVQSCQFLSKRTFLKLKKEKEVNLKLNAGNGLLNYDVITKDKFYFNAILVGNNLSCLKNEGLIVRGNLLIAGQTFPASELSNLFKEDVILKNVALEAGEGIIVMTFRNNIHWMNKESLSEVLKNNRLGDFVWVVQKRYASHPVIQKVNSTALNTTRIVTILKDGVPTYLGGFQAFATRGANTDSWSRGSVYVGIDIDKECLTSQGVLSVHDERGGFILKHPDSDVEFKDYHLPFLKDAVKLCLQAHSLLYFNYVIGWDVAITESGPLIVEANEKPGMNVIQILNGSLKAHFQI